MVPVFLVVICSSHSEDKSRVASKDAISNFESNTNRSTFIVWMFQNHPVGRIGELFRLGTVLCCQEAILIERKRNT